MSLKALGWRINGAEFYELLATFSIFQFFFPEG